MDGTSREEKLNAAFVELADTLIADFDVVDLLHTLMEECIEILGTQAGGLMLADSRGVLELIASTSERAEFVEIMQVNAGAGPCFDCFATGVVVTVADIAESAAQWPDFQAAALGRGFHSVHAVPMRLRGQIIGTMNLFGTSIGELASRDIAVVQALADVATIGILQERLISEASLVTEQLQRALNSRILIEQAKGVLAQAGTMEMSEAFAVLREYARNNNLRLRTVAEGVTTGTLNVLGAAHTRASSSNP